jgi:hypothetical protein
MNWEAPHQGVHNIPLRICLRFDNDPQRWNIPAWKFVNQLKGMSDVD